jgi:hypothetical protein
MNVLPTTRNRTLLFGSSVVVAVLMAIVSGAGFMLRPGGLDPADQQRMVGVTASTAGILLPGFLVHDVLNLVVGLPILLGSLWFARRGSLIGLLLWPGALFYVLYTYTQYAVGAPFDILFLPYVALVAVSAYTLIGLIASIPGEDVRRQLTGFVPARTVGGILVGLALLTLAQDAGGALAAAMANGPIIPIARHVWIADLVVEVPAVLLGGLLLWQRKPLGYVAGGGLLLQYGMTPLVLSIILVLQPVLTGSALDTATVGALLLFCAVSFLPLAYFTRGLRKRTALRQSA